MNHSISMILFSLILIFQTAVKAQDVGIEKVLVLAPKEKELEKDTRKKERRLEWRHIDYYGDHIINAHQPLLETGLTTEANKMHAAYLIEFAEELSMQNYLAFIVSMYLQQHSIKLESCNTFLPVCEGNDFSLTALEVLAEREAADYIIFCDKIRYLFEDSELFMHPSLNLYDAKLNKIVYEHYPKYVRDNECFSTTMTNNNRSFTVKTIARKDYLAIRKIIFSK